MESAGGQFSINAIEERNNEDDEDSMEESDIEEVEE